MAAPPVCAECGSPVACKHGKPPFNVPAVGIMNDVATVEQLLLLDASKHEREADRAKTWAVKHDDRRDLYLRYEKANRDVAEILRREAKATHRCEESRNWGLLAVFMLCVLSAWLAVYISKHLLRSDDARSGALVKSVK